MLMRTSFVTRFLALGALGALTLVLAACSEGVSTQEAAARCDIERQNSTSVLEESYAQCIACQEECGDDCKAQGKTPEEYACPVED